MKLKDILNVLEHHAPLAYQESYDNSGLLVGNDEDEIEGALLCIDCTPEVIEEALAKKANLVICHHPIIFTGLKRLTGRNYVERTIVSAIRNKIAIYACHTNLDNVFHGVSKKMADKIGLEDCRILAPKTGALKKLVTFCPDAKCDEVRASMFKAGAGHIGDYDSCSFSVSGHGTFRGGEGTNPYVGNVGEMHIEAENRIEVIFPAYLQQNIIHALVAAHPYEEVAYDIYSLDNDHPGVGSGMIGKLKEPLDFAAFLNDIKNTFKCQAIRYTEKIKKKVSTVALCGGSGSFLLPQAIDQGADVFVSADFKYHDFFDADGNISIVDIGHYESEQFTTELFAEIISKKFPTFALYFSDINTNPIKTF